jgi:agmatine/peptidylarginine deiminase
MRKGYIIALTLIILVIVGAAYAEETEDEFLPIGLTEEELLRLDEIGINHVITDAPVGNLRNPAEWERSEGVIIRWPLGISIAIVAEMSEDVMVTTVVANTTERTQAINSYTAGGVNMSNTQFIIAPTNSIWTRDYGPWFIYVDNEIGIVDHIYNRPRPYDDVIPQVIGTQWSIDVYGMDLITTGGNHMSDGLGMSMSTRLVYDENPNKTHAQVDSIMLAYLGNDYTVLEYIESGGIHHIDCWAKFLSPSTILIKDVSPGNPSYNLLNQRAQWLSQQTSAWGVPYNIVRVFCPTGTAYTNSLILNDKVLVPIFGSYYDSTALQIYRDAMPGYEVLGFTGSWYDDDAIHCRAMGVPDMQMLFVDHDPLQDMNYTPDDYLVSVKIVDNSGQGLIPDSLKVYYKIDDGLWNSTLLNSTPTPDSFTGYIPSQPSGSIVSYYIKAADSSGRVETHPFIGAPGTHAFEIFFGPGCDYTIGDANNNGEYNGLDITYGVTYFKGGPEPPYACECTDGHTWFVAGDVNGSCSYNGLDITYGVAYFKGGPDPVPCADCPPVR